MSKYLSAGGGEDAFNGAGHVDGVPDICEQLFIGVRSTKIQHHLDPVARSWTGAEHTDGAWNDEVTRGHIVVRTELSEALDLRLELFDPGRTRDRVVVEAAECGVRRTDVTAAVFQLIKRVDQPSVRREQKPNSLHYHLDMH